MVASAPGNAEDPRAVRELIEEGAIRPAIDAVFPFERVVDAHRYVEDGRKGGHIAISFDA